MTEKLKEQLDQVSFAYRSQFTSEPAEQLAALLAQELPGDVNWSFFVNSGSEAIETAMKIAIQYWQEKKQTQKSIFVSMEQLPRNNFGSAFIVWFL